MHQSIEHGKNNPVLINVEKCIGDCVISTSLIHELNKKGYKVGLNTTEVLAPLFKNQELQPVSSLPNPIGVKLDHFYLTHLPHRFQLPIDFTEGLRRYGHLLDWMAYELYALSSEKGNPIKVRPKLRNVKISLSTQEIVKAYSEKLQILDRTNNNTLTFIVPQTSSINKNIPPKLLENIVEQLTGSTAICMMEPLSMSNEEKEKYKSRGAFILEQVTLRESIARLYTADVVITTDTGMMHSAIATRQGTDPKIPMKLLNYIPSNTQVIAVLGSSRPEVVANYSRMHTVTTLDPCSSCGAHAYFLLDLLENKIGIHYYDLGDGSGCRFPEAQEKKSVPCMEHIKPEQIVEVFNTALVKGRNTRH